MDALFAEQKVVPPSVGSLRELGKRNQRLRTHKTSEVVARRLADFMIQNDLAEGSRLPPEKEMLGLLGVGRSTLREALRLLESHGIISIRTGPMGGPIVRRPQTDDFSETLMLLLQFEKTTLDEVLTARATLEPALAALAAVRITDEQLAQLQETVDLIRVPSCDNATFQEQNARFHALVADASGNSVLRLMGEALRALGDSATSGAEYDADTRKMGAESHQKILDALRARDPEAARSSSIEHLELGRDSWIRRFPELLERPISWS